MSTSVERRSPSLESMSSAFSFDDNPGIPPIGPNVSVQSASQGVVSNFWTQAEQEDWLPESERMGSNASLRVEHSKSYEVPQAPVDAYPMHERFCFPAENIYFLVEGVLYSVHRYFFERDSSSFVGQGLSKQEPMVLTNVSTHDFDLFLSILYPTSFGVHPASTVEEWSGILYLADKWSFLSIRTLAVAQIAPIASSIDKIVFGRLYNINEWLTSAYHAVCIRLDALSLEEGRRLGVDDVIRINAIRQEFCFIRISGSSPKLFEEDVKSRFGLAIQREPAASEKRTKHVADKLKADDAAEATSKKEEAAKAADIQRKKREAAAVEKRQTEEAEDKARELEAKRAQKLREAEKAKVAEIEQQQKRREATDREAKDLEDRRAQEQSEAEAKAADSEQKKAEAASAEAKTAEEQHPESPAVGNQRPESPTVAKSSKKNKKKSKKAGPPARGDTTDVESAASTPVDEKSNETMLARALEEARDAQAKEQQEKDQQGPEATEKLQTDKEEADAKRLGTTSPKSPAKVTWANPTVPPKSTWGAACLKAASGAVPAKGATGAEAPQGTAANEEEDWSHLSHLTALNRYHTKKAKIDKERDAEEQAELVKQMKQQLADETRTAEGGATHQAASGTCTSGMSNVSNTSISITVSKKDDWSHLSPAERHSKKRNKYLGEYHAETEVERVAKVLKDAKQQMVDEAKAAEEAAAQRPCL